MEKDTEETDKYDRLLRYVFLPPPDGRLLNEEMLRAGMARAYTRFPFSRKKAFLAAEAGARRRNGLWKDREWRKRGGSPGNAAPSRCTPPGKDFVLATRGSRKPGGARGPSEEIEVSAAAGGADGHRIRVEGQDRGFRRSTRRTPARRIGVPGTARTPGGSPIRGTVIPWEDAHRHEGERSSSRDDRPTHRRRR